MDLLEIMQNRRSVRKYTGEPVSEENLKMILQAGLLSPAGRNIGHREFVVIKDKDMLQKLSVCRTHGSGPLAGADCAIAVFGKKTATDIPVEDCAIAMTQMHLMADALGVGSCWIQGRLREAPDGRMADEYVRELLGVPEEFMLEAILSLGMPDEHPAPHRLEELAYEKIHRENW